MDRATIPSAPRALTAALYALALGACGSAPPPPTRIPLQIVHRDAGPDLAVRPRPSGGVVALSLFIDAGARDADPPQVAAVAVQLAAEGAGDGVTGRAWPDGSELTIRCPAREAAGCVRRLARALATRTPSEAQVARVRARLAAARQAALVRDPGAQADRLALTAAVGDVADALIPLGTAERDAEVDAGRVGAFLASHYGPGRAMLVGAGDVSVEALESASSHAFSQGPRASAKRAQRAALTGDGSVLVDVDDGPGLSMALVAPDGERAAGAARAMRARLLRQRVARRVRGHVFPLRGGGIALLRIDTGRPEGALTAAAHELALLRAADSSHRNTGAPTAGALSSDDSLDALLHQAGLRWLSSGGAPGDGDAVLGVGVLVAGGRADRATQDDPDRAVRERSTTAMRDALERGYAAARAEPDGEMAATQASVKLANGARVELRKQAGDAVAVAVRFAPGAAADPPVEHGRSALLAHAAVTACAGRGPGSLQEHLVELGANLRPRVDGDSWGLLLTAPAAHAEQAARLALDCALEPWLARSHVTTARLRHRRGRDRPVAPGELRARAAEALSPDAPGRLAPWGSGDGMANVSLAALQQRSQRGLRGDRVSVAAVGPVAVERTTRSIVRRLALLPGPGAADPEAASSSAAAQSTAAPTAEVLQPTLALLLWRAESAAPHAAGAIAFAAMMGDGLARLEGVRVPWHDGGVLGTGGWAAVAVVGDAEVLAALQSGLSEARGAIDLGRLGDAVGAAHSRYESALAARAGRTAERADALARAGLADAGSGSAAHSASRDVAGARTLAAALARSAPIFHALR